MPAGLANPVACFAWSLFPPMPMEQARPVRASTAAWMSAARRAGTSVSAARKASSQPSTSTTTGKVRSVAMTCSDAAQ